MVGADAVIKAADNAHGSITVYGDLTSTGWVSNSGSYNLTVNLYGNLSISYHFVPYAFNWLGAGNKVLSTYTESGYGLRARTTTIAEEVDAIYAATDICFKSNSYTPVITGGTAQATFRLWDPATLQPHRLVSSSCRLEKLTVQGLEGSEFNFNNSYSLSNVYMTDCNLADVTTTGIHALDTGCSLTNITNTGSIYNQASASRTVNQYGYLVNSGQIGQAPHGYQFTVYSYGNISNSGLFKPSYLYLKGPAARELQSTEANPIQASGAIYGEAGLGDIHPGDQLWFANIPAINGPISFKAYTLDRTSQPKTLHFANTLIQNASVSGMAGSAIHGSELRLDNTPLTDIATEGTISFSGTSNITRIVNNGVIQNGNSGSTTLNIWGDFVNYGTVTSSSGYQLSINAYDDIRNYGTWTNHDLNMQGDDAQDICFGPLHPFAGLYFYDANTTAGIYVVEEDLYIQANTVDLNYSTLYVNPGGFGLHISGATLQEAYISSDLGNIINMTNSARLSSVGLQSITNNGSLDLITSINLSGDLVNNGTVRNTGASINFSVSGNLTNNGSIANGAGYYLSVYIGGSAVNNGSWNNYLTRMNGAADQLIHFPPEHPCTGAQFTDTVAGSVLFTNADLYFSGCNLDLNYAPLRLNDGRTGPYDVTLDNCQVNETVFQSDLGSTLTGGNGAKLVLANNAYLGALVLDEIIWEGTVQIGGGVSVDHLINNAIVQNWGSSSQTLTINQRLDNNASGVLQNNVYNLYLSLFGDLYDDGQLRNYEVNFRGSGDQNIFQSAAADTIRCTNLKKTNASGRVVMLSDLVIKSCNVDLNNRDLVMVSGRTPHTLSLYGGYLQNLRLESAASAILYMANSAFLTGNITCGNMVWQGSVSIGTSVYIGDLVNQALISNRSGGSAYLYVNGNLDNHGTITNSDAYPMYLYLYGNLSDSGILSNRYTYLNGTGVQTIWQATSADAIRCVYLRKTVASGDVALLSDLRMVGCYLDLNGRSLDLGGGGMDHALAMSGGYITSTILSSPGNGVLNLSNGCYLNSVSGGNVTLQGAVIIRGTCYFGNVTNTAVTSNYASETSNLYVSGSLINSGSFQNDGWPLYLRISGHLTNNGALANRRVYMTGSTNQNVFFNGTETLQHLTLNSDIGSAQWYHDGSYSGTTGGSIDLAMDNPLLYGSWQAYVPASDTWGRIVTVSPAGAITQPQNLTISLDPGGVKLSWDQVAGAVSYKIYASQNAVAGFTEIMGGIIGPDPGDGSVEQVLEASLQARFFRVTASN